MRLGLVFSRGISLKQWVDKGLFEREKLIYEKHLAEGVLDEVVWFTYGIRDEEVAQRLKEDGILDPRIRIVPKPERFRGYVGDLTYSVIMPRVHEEVFHTLDVLKTNQMDGAWTGVFASRRYNIPLIVRVGYMWHDTAPDPFRRLLRKGIEKYVFSRTSWIELPKESYRKQIPNAWVVPNYIDTALFFPDPMRRVRNRVLFVGRLVRIKNLLALADATQQVGLGLDVVGDGPLRAELERFDHVRLLGTVPNSKLPQVLNGYWFFALTSLKEGMPKALLEAMSCGLVVIGTPVEGIREFVGPDRGLLSEGIDARAIAKVLEYAKGLGERDLRRIGAVAAAYVRENFSLDAVAQREAELFEEIRRRV